MCAGSLCTIQVSVPGNITGIFYCDNCAAKFAWGTAIIPPCGHNYFGVQLDANGDLEAVYCRDCKTHVWASTTYFGVNMGQIIGTTPLAPVSTTTQTATPHPGNNIGWVIPGLWGGLISPEKPKEEKPAETPGPVLCISCQRELSAYLDAWYGDKDDPQGKRCDPCRRNR